MTTLLHTPFEHWEDEFQKRVLFFADACTVKGSNRVLMLPDLLRLLIRLSADERIPSAARTDFQDIVDSTLRGIDYLPDNDSSMVSLIDDVRKVAKVLEKHLSVLPADIVWQGQDDLAATVGYLLYNPERYTPEC